ncbi:YbaB/EbfC family nucleoid-associated protein [Nocardia sp. NPDC003482]|uniref:YbaB/EbfC family nucleoid-associated protein n=1 Tax=Nocardia sp. NPDC004068 TaxID=3364303 RepID=UPI0036C24966
MTGALGPGSRPDLREDIESTLQNISRLQRERLRLVGRASVRRNRVTATVNADGVLVDLKFGRDVEDLDYADLARAVVEAAQEATADVGRKARELMAPLEEQRARLPKLSDLVPGMPDLRDRMPGQERAPVTKPVQEIFGDRTDGKPGVTDSGW